MAARLGATPDAVALAAAAQQPWADRVLLGPAGVGQLEENLGAGEIILTADDLALLTVGHRRSGRLLAAPIGAALAVTCRRRPRVRQSSPRAVA